MLTLLEKILFVMVTAAALFLAQRTFRLAVAVIGRGEGKLSLDELPRRVWRAVSGRVRLR